MFLVTVLSGERLAARRDKTHLMPVLVKPPEHDWLLQSPQGIQLKSRFGDVTTNSMMCKCQLEHNVSGTKCSHLAETGEETD